MIEARSAEGGGMRNVNQILEGKAGRIVAVPQEAPVLEVIRLMAEHHIGSVLVMQGHELVGIATERDYARKVILQGRSSAETPVSQIMSSPVVTISPTDTAQTCMQLMTHRKIRHLPVVEDGRVLGLVSIGDLVKAVIEDQQQEIAQLHQYIAS
jgi:CBS domain-containing protein